MSQTSQLPAPPRVSVLMPTFKHASFIRRALESLRVQTLTNWELVLIDDGSPDDTRAVVGPYLDDQRFRYHRLEHNQGLGAALNLATSLARGQYLAYLPSDDLYYPDHLARLVDLLDANPTIYLAYGGVRWGYQNYGPTLQGERAVGCEAEVLANPPMDWQAPLPNGNILALVQVAHRRSFEDRVHWASRAEIVSDCLEPDFWRALLACGAKFGYSGAITCEWVEHPDQRHAIIAGLKTSSLSYYRSFYGVGRGEWLNWQPSRGECINEGVRYGRFARERPLPRTDGLKILLVGELGFNPERILAFEERGHKLYGLWIRHPEAWDTAGPLPFGNIEHIPSDRKWPERVREIQPDIIYALLNWQAVEFIGDVLDAALRIPFVFHFKEGPFLCLEKGLWPTLIRILGKSHGQIFINAECFEWFQLATDRLLDPAIVMILDGDLPKQDWLTDDWAVKLSSLDGETHTVCPGRPLGLTPFEAIAKAGIHVHFYGNRFHRQFPNWAKNGVATGFMHLHPTVEPADWVCELSRYDAAWFHVFESFNAGDLRRAHWDDLNLPARLGTYAAAGLPWILKDNRHSRVAVQSLAQQHDVGLFFNTFDDLADQLRDRERMAQLTANMRAVRHTCTFDAHASELIAFFRRVIERHQFSGK